MDNQGFAEVLDAAAEKIGEVFLSMYVNRGKKGTTILTCFPERDSMVRFCPMGKVADILSNQEPVTSKITKCLESGSYEEENYVLLLSPNEVLGMGFRVELREISHEVVDHHLLTGASEEELAALELFKRRKQQPKRPKPRGFG